MRIIKVDIQGDDRRGLGFVKLNRLGPIVALVGKNGAGKTRILDLLYEKVCTRDYALSFEFERSYFFKDSNKFVKKLDATELGKGHLKIKEFISAYHYCPVKIEHPEGVPPLSFSVCRASGSKYQ